MHLELADRKFPPQGMSFDFEKNFIAEGYLNLFQNGYRSLADTNINITRAQYISGTALYSYNLCRDMSFGDQIGSKPFVGSLKLRASWQEATKEATVLLCVGYYESNLYINKHRQPYLSSI